VTNFNVPYVSDAKRNYDKVRGKAVVTITSLGKQKAESFAGSGPAFNVLATLNEQGPCSISELGRETSMEEDKVKHILRSLRSEGYISVQRVRE